MTATWTTDATSRARELPGGADLLDTYRAGDGLLVERRGAGVAGAGVRSRLAVEGGPGRLHRLAELAMDSLGRSPVAGPAGAPSLPVALGALPFDEARPAELVVPRLLTVRRGGEAWSVGDDAGDAPAPPGERGFDPGGPGAAGFERAVALAVRRIRAGGLDKVVLARRLTVTRPSAASPAAVVRRLRAADPHCFTYAFPLAEPRGGTLVGASPELLVRRIGDSVVSVPLAGSMPRSAEPAADRDAVARLLASRKDREEHRYVIEAVVAALEPLCSSVEVAPGPSITSTATVWHLATTVRGRLRHPAADALSVAAALHPTPAVCGTPRERALATIGELEGFDRGPYAGMVGWIDGAGDGEWAVTLRCAELRGSSARLYAGNGIVAESQPEAELAETEAKFAALLNALG